MRPSDLGAALLCSALSLAAMSPAMAQQGTGAPNPGSEEILRALAPPAPSRPLTRSLGGGAVAAAPRTVTRQIRIEAAEPAAEVIRKVEELKLPSIAIRVLFAYDSDALTPEGAASLRPLAEALQDSRLREMRFLLAGHTDARGSDIYNDTLSSRRARAVQDHLIASYRVDPSRLQSIGFGERKLADPGYPEGPANRRVEVISLTQYAAQ